MLAWRAVTALVIVLAVVVVVGLVLLLAFAPKLQGKEKAASELARQAVGGEDTVRFLDPRVVGFGTEPDEAGGLRGMGVLAVSDDTIAFVTWHPQEQHTIERGAVREVSTEAAGVEDASKAMIRVRYAAADDDGEVVAGYRVKDPVRWLEALGASGGTTPPDLAES